jgi:hypothetical protein
MKFIYLYIGEQCKVGLLVFYHKSTSSALHCGTVYVAFQYSDGLPVLFVVFLVTIGRQCLYEGRELIACVCKELIVNLTAEF